jgi:hypothetical protein
MAASVEDFPEPVGPVTRTIPFLSEGDIGELLRQHQLLQAGNGVRNDAHHNGISAALAKDVDAEAADVRNTVGDVC